MAAMVVLYGIKTCSTVKKAMKWLEEQDIAFQYHDVRKDGVTSALLTSWCALLGWEKLLNRSSLTFRRLDNADKEGLDESKAIALMMAHPTLIRRPVTVMGERVVVGFKPELYEGFFNRTA
ncbi:arsenate reductase [Bombella saccharophila]|uniref:Arsenate reductase n=1 Tax=Bombella saccharophila TaxID=2967338 RepID=A0ABT3W726_9PROT|nr:arsenate reductase [Bombella saccharophila]MCX5614900.1 arsenate reductase [Bombella saccharophila]PHI96385.1 arsenate reductase [Parasaccharibacter apium]